MVGGLLGLGRKARKGGNDDFICNDGAELERKEEEREKTKEKKKMKVKKEEDECRVQVTNKSPWRVVE